MQGERGAQCNGREEQKQDAKGGSDKGYFGDVGVKAAGCDGFRHSSMRGTEFHVRILAETCSACSSPMCNLLTPARLQSR